MRQSVVAEEDVHIACHREKLRALCLEGHDVGLRRQEGGQLQRELLSFPTHDLGNGISREQAARVTDKMEQSPFLPPLLTPSSKSTPSLPLPFLPFLFLGFLLLIFQSAATLVWSTR